MLATPRDKDPLIGQGAELMARVTTIACALSADLSSLPLDAVVYRARAAVQVAGMGVALGQCLSWLADTRQDEVVDSMMELLRSSRRLTRGGAAVMDRVVLPPQWEALRQEVDAYRQRVLESVWDGTGVLPFPYAQT